MPGLVPFEPRPAVDEGLGAIKTVGQRRPPGQSRKSRDHLTDRRDGRRTGRLVRLTEGTPPDHVASTLELEPESVRRTTGRLRGETRSREGGGSTGPHDRVGRAIGPAGRRARPGQVAGAGEGPRSDPEPDPTVRPGLLGRSTAPISSPGSPPASAPDSPRMPRPRRPGGPSPNRPGSADGRGSTSSSPSTTARVSRGGPDRLDLERLEHLNPDPSARLTVLRGPSDGGA